MNYSTSSIYTDILVRNLLVITELNTQIREYSAVIDRQNPEYIALQNNSKAEMFFHYLHILNVHMQLKDTRKLVFGMNKPAENSKERVALNVRNILDYVNASYQSERFNLSLLVHINKLFLDDIKDIWDIGKMIHTEKDIDATYDIPIHKEFLLQSNAASYMKHLEDFYYTNQSPEILKAAIISHELFTHSLFSSGNDATVLGMLNFFFKKDGFSELLNYFKCITNIMNSLKRGDEFFSLEAWLDLFFNEVAKELKEVKNKITPFIEDNRAEHTRYVDLNLRQIKGLHYIKEKGKISREIYAKLNSISQITSYRDLSNMLQKGYVRVEGIGKGTKYIL